MKRIKYIQLLIVVVVAGIFFSSCEYDNYDEPNVEFSGTLMNGDNPLDTRWGVLFKLYQYKEDGFADAGARSIDVFVDQEGKFSSKLFPGRYKMVVYSEGGVNYIYNWNDFPTNSGGNLDTLYFTLDKNKKLDFSVTPFYEIKDFEAFYRNDSIISRFTIKKNTDRTDTQVLFRRVAALVSPTIHVNNDTELLATKTGATVDTPIEIKCSLKDYYSNTYYKNNFRDYAYVRIAVSLRLTGQESVYSKIIKVTGIPDETIKKFK